MYVSLLRIWREWQRVARIYILEAGHRVPQILPGDQGVRCWHIDFRAGCGGRELEYMSTISLYNRPRAQEPWLYILVERIDVCGPDPHSH